MILGRITTRNFRNLAEAEWPFHPSVNLIVGDNGQGKTNLLEAIYVLGSTRSFRTARIENVVRIGATDLFLEGTVRAREIDRKISLGLRAGDERRRELLVNGQKSPVHDYVQVLHLLAYSSSQLEIVRGSPEWRRRFVDRGVAGIEPAHLPNLNRYMRVVRQRNALLHDVRAGRQRPSTLDPWDEEIVAAGGAIVLARRRYIEVLEKTFRTVVYDHAYHVEDLHFSYEPAALQGEPGLDRAVILEHRSRDIRVGFTTVGPHRDAIEFIRSGRAAAEMLSSGEIKMTVLFLTLAAIEIYRAKYGERPILLLDDLDAELDLGIVRKLLRYLVGTTQIFTTSAKEPLLREIEFGPHRRFMLQAGSVVATNDVSS